MKPKMASRMMLRIMATTTPITAPQAKTLKTVPQGSLWNLSVFLNQMTKMMGGMKAKSRRMENVEMASSPT